MTYDASDNTGMRAVRLDIGGQSRRVASSMRLSPSRPVPGSPRVQARACRRARLTASTIARVVAEDAAGNETVRRQRPSGVDGTPPTRRARASPRPLDRASRVTDAASGVASAALEVRTELDGAVPDARRQGRERSADRQARPGPRLARRHARDRPRRGGQRHAGQPDAPLGHEREDRPALPQGALRAREGAVRPRRDAARAAHALRRAVVRRPDDRRDRRGPPSRCTPAGPRAAR